MKLIKLLSLCALACSFTLAASATMAPACPNNDPAICSTDTSAPSCPVVGSAPAQKATCPAGKAPVCSKVAGVTVAVCEGGAPMNKQPAALVAPKP